MKCEFFFMPVEFSFRDLYRFDVGQKERRCGLFLSLEVLVRGDYATSHMLPVTCLSDGMPNAWIVLQFFVDCAPVTWIACDCLAGDVAAMKLGDAGWI